jgi:hypothetical protein
LAIKVPDDGESTSKAEPQKLIQIQVRLLANLKSYSPAGEDSFMLSVDKTETVQSILNRFGLPPALQQPVVIINGRPAKTTTLFSDGDNVLVYEPVTGG